jgi:hypothetical protein
MVVPITSPFIFPAHSPRPQYIHDLPIQLVMDYIGASYRILRCFGAWSCCKLSPTDFTVLCCALTSSWRIINRLSTLHC